MGTRKKSTPFTTSQIESLVRLTGDKSPLSVRQRDQIVLQLLKPSSLDHTDSKEDAGGYTLAGLKAAVRDEIDGSEILEISRGLLQSDDSIKSKVHVFEAIVLHASENDLQTCSEWFDYRLDGFFHLVNPKIRHQFVQFALNIANDWDWEGFYLRNADQSFLTFQEMWLSFQIIKSHRGRANALGYLWPRREAILEPLQSQRTLSGLEWAEVVHICFRVAVEEKDTDAIDYFFERAWNEVELRERLQPDLDRIVESEDFLVRSSYHSSLLKASTWDQRLKILSHSLEQVRHNSSMIDALFLNTGLKKLRSWTEAGPEFTRRLSQLLLAHHSSRDKLPNLFDLFEQSIWSFSDSPTDLALWQPVHEAKRQVVVPVKIMKAAHFRKWLHRESEADLWRARSLSMREPSGRMIWAQDLGKLQGIVNTIVKGTENSRADRLLAHLEVAVDTVELSYDKVSRYLSLIEQPAHRVIESLEHWANDQGDDRLQLNLLRKRSVTCWLTNQDLNHLFKLSARIKNFDLSWRTASVVHSRKVLKLQASHAWELSGECRSGYPMLTPRHMDLEDLYPKTQPKWGQFIASLLRVGPVLEKTLLQENLVVEPQLSYVKISAAAVSRLDKALTCVVMAEGGATPVHLSGRLFFPHWARQFPQSHWSELFCSFFHCFGAASWGWRLDELQRLLKSLLPSGTSSQPGAKWLKALHPLEKKAIFDLLECVNTLPSQGAYEVIQSFFMKLSIYMSQNHRDALAGLRELGAGLPLIHAAESFILSDKYHELRHRRGISHRVPVPDSIGNEGILMQETL